MRLVSRRYLENRGIDLDKILGREKASQRCRDPRPLFEKWPAVSMNMGLPPGRRLCWQPRRRLAHTAISLEKRPRRWLAKGQVMAIVPPFRFAGPFGQLFAELHAKR
jgi:hypothetical protein